MVLVMNVKFVLVTFTTTFIVNVIVAKTNGLEFCQEVEIFEGVAVLCNNKTFRYMKHDVPMFPSTVDVNCDLFDVLDVNEDASTITIYLDVIMSWNDTRLDVKTTDEDWNWLRVEQYKDHIWMPSMDFLNLRDMEGVASWSGDDTVSLWLSNPALTLEFTRSARVTVTCDFDFSSYPFDSHTCDVIMGDADYGLKQLLYNKAVVYHRGTGSDKQEWIHLDKMSKGFQIKVTALDPLIRSEKSTGNEEQFSYTGLRLKLARSSWTLATSYYGPTVIFVILSWLSFVIPTEQVAGRMGLLVTLYLITINTFGNTRTPPNHGFSLVELWLCGVQLPIFLAMLEYGYILHQIKSGRFKKVKEELDIKSKKSKKIANCCFERADQITCICSILYFVIFNVTYWCYATTRTV